MFDSYCYFPSSPNWVATNAELSFLIRTIKSSSTPHSFLTLISDKERNSLPLSTSVTCIRNYHSLFACCQNHQF